MKKLLSLALALTMILSLASVLGLTVSAANALEKTYDAANNGDVLYNVVFDKTDGVYVPKTFSAASNDLAKDLKVTVADNGKTVTLLHSNKESGRTWWGSAIDGLVLGEGKQYTVSAEVSFTRHRSGIYLTFGPVDTDSNAHEKAIGIYGNEKDGCFMYGGDALYGKYASNGDYVSWYLHETTVPDSVKNDVHKNIIFVIDGYDVYVYMDGYFFDMTTIPALDGYDKLGISGYLYSSNAEMTIKNVTVKKGLSLISSTTFPTKTIDMWADNTNPSDPSYQGKDYASAKDGDKLVDLRFNSRTGVYAPGWSYKEGVDDTKSVFSANEATIVKSLGGHAWYGGKINGYKMTPDTTYTYQFKVKCVGAKSGGVFFNSGNANSIFLQTRRSPSGVYGNFNDTTKTLEMRMITLRVSHTIDFYNKHNYTDIDYAGTVKPLVDKDGYTDVRIVLKGYDYLFYVMDESGEYKFVEDYTLSKQYDIGNDDNLAFYVLNDNNNTTFSVKDAAVYKGDLFSVKEDTPVTPDPTPTPNPGTGDMSTVLAFITLVALAGVVITKKAFLR